FSRTKYGADKIVKVLRKSDIVAEAIHGNKSQNARQKALKNFKKGTTTVLVATDIAARGIDVDELSLVVNFDLPNVPETYVHRIGRTGRASASGIALSFCMMEERPYLRDIQKLIKQQLPVREDHPFPDEGEESEGQKPKKQQSNNNRRRKPNSQSSRRSQNWGSKKRDRRD
ncbi:MAG: ATP-dependent RNA helicase RhlE, partial [Maribacter sp.]